MFSIHNKHRYNHNSNHHHHLAPPHFVITILLLLLVLSSAAGKRTLGSPVSSQPQEEKLSLRGQIGSRPPRCEKKCPSCDHCVAIQIPTGRSKNVKSRVYKLTYSRSDIDNSNYKPMSWKCKCGNIILNP